MTIAVSDLHSAQRDALLERLLESTAGAINIFTVYIGDRLGYYEALAQHGSLTSVDLAWQTSTHERYAREWLEQQTVAGILEVENPHTSPRERRFVLPTGHQEVLAEPESLNYLAPLAQAFVGATSPIRRLVQSFRTGAGIPFGDFGPDMREGQARMNRNLFLYQLGQEYLSAIPDLHARLQSDRPAHIADIGCGYGWSSIGMALSHPNAHVDGFDFDSPSIEQARLNAQEQGVADRTTFHARDVAEAPLLGAYELVTAFECIHDMTDPVSALRTMRRLAGDTGVVLVMDERTSDQFLPEGNEVEWLFYGFSVLHCLPAGMAEDPAVGTATVMRVDTLHRYARAAGFRKVEILPLHNDFFRFY